MSGTVKNIAFLYAMMNKLVSSLWQNSDVQNVIAGNTLCFFKLAMLCYCTKMEMSILFEESECKTTH